MKAEISGRMIFTYYIITMVFHDQSVDISGPIAKLNQDLANLGFPNHYVHTGPIIRRENEYEFESLQTRRRILNSMVTFIKYCNIRYHCFHIEKKHIDDSVQACFLFDDQRTGTRCAGTYSRNSRLLIL